MEGGNNERRASRSDVHLGKEEEAKIEGETRDYFDGIAPKRHSKPQRSEHSTKYQDALSNSQSSDQIPEFLAFQELQSRQKMVNEEGIKEGVDGSEEEFVETEYYKDLNCVDKQHHTTGTGFIKMEGSANGKGFSLRPDADSGVHSSSRGNPATNDWIPVDRDYDELDISASTNPKRSEN
ncbi:maternal effect embryo arrest 59 [Euphorbia peplus]|nr:maternal effect embryo arrest 59 [Euphorbia peplus]